jgi:thioredoxin-related protein
MNKIVVAALGVAVILGAAYGLGFFTSSQLPPIKEESHVTKASHVASAEPHIAWFEGSVEEAFAKAEAEGKPVLLYWGAVWCPPCNQLKVTTFKRPDFIAKTEEFVAVYLDGDTDRAQKYGEDFGASGYPTLIVLNGRDEEVTRIPGGMNLEAYVHVLDLALARVQPAGQLLQEIVDEGRTPSEDELSLLAHYSWGQDKGRALGDRKAIEVFRALSSLTPETMIVEKSRFDVAYLGELADLEDRLEDSVRTDAVNRTLLLLSDTARIRAQPYFATFDAKEVIEKISDKESKDRLTLLTALEAGLKSMWTDESYSPAGRLRILFGEARLAKLTGDEIPRALKIRTRKLVDKERAAAVSQYERSAVTNMAVGVLFATDQNDYAGEVMKHEIEGSTNAYYWMVDLADLAEQADQTDEAVKWLQKAFDSAEGPATRVQWGSYYVDGLTRMRADDPALVQTVASQVLKELAGQEDPVYGRNKGAVKRIARSLNSWAQGGDVEEGVRGSGLDAAALSLRNQAHATVTAQFDEICASHFDGGDKLDACHALFRPVEA